DAVQERIHITGADTHRYPGTDTDPGNRQGGSPKFDMRGTKGALDDFASYGDTHMLDDDVVAVEFSDDSEVISQVLSDSAVGEVMSQADDDYFGPAADLTHTPSEVLHDSLAPPVPLGESTLFDSESLKQELSDRFAHN